MATPVQRKTAQYSFEATRFVTQTKDYDRQFSSVYFARLAALRPAVEAKARKLWPGVPVVSKIIDARASETDVIVCGGVFKTLQALPNLLKEYSEYKSISGFKWGEKKNFVGDKDSVALEDDSGRVKVVSNSIALLSRTPTGVVIAARGRLLETGELELHEFCTAGALDTAKTTVEDTSILLVSGLGLGSSPSAEAKLAHETALRMLVDFITGHLGSKEDAAVAASISRVIVAGNSFSGDHTDKPHVLSDLDTFFYRLATSVHVDVMPGETDPASFALPQQPIGRAMFSASGSLNTFHSVPNPYHCKIGGAEILGSSGQNLDNVMKVTSIEDPLEALSAMITDWRHIAPSAPDTLGCFPFDSEGDPFLLSSTPRVFFAGNQAQLGYRKLAGLESIVLAVPSFCQSHTAVLLNLKTLEVTPISFTAASSV